MFLLDPTFGASWETAEAEVRRILGRADADVAFCKKWAERRLAYKVKGRKRGIYVLTYFKAGPDKIKGIERDSRLSENVLRVLVMRADDVTPDHMEKALLHAQERPATEGGEGGDMSYGRPRFQGEGDGYRPDRDRGGDGPRRGPRAGGGRRRDESAAEPSFAD
ncbi:MAG: 30S ribosomal protein S6 [Planctomycetes bacterium]|nr:30S ribosomal protein S6 [Planctomycetota bacterium]